MPGEIIEEGRDVIVFQSFAGDLGGDVSALEFLGQSISDLGIREYNWSIHG